MTSPRADQRGFADRQERAGDLVGGGDRWWRLCGAALLGAVILPWLALAALQAAISLIAVPLLASAVFAAAVVVAVAGRRASWPRSI